jgi:heme/copper-type cytochrome/quinol oxidase subunit 2
MTWLWILIGIAVVAFLFSKFSGQSNEDSAANAAGAAMVGGSCMLQIFFYVIGILIVLWIFGFLFS